MGILNVTPDSFSDGARFLNPEKALRQACEMLDSGADLIDVGGESTRPQAEIVSADEEIERVTPVIAALRKERPNCVISIDTSKSAVAAKAIEFGANIINDVSGLQADLELARIAASSGAGLILMHRRGGPETMQNPENLVYGNLLNEIMDFLESAMDQAMDLGVDFENLAIDPGIGFSKNMDQNLMILGNVDMFSKLKRPILIGHSRKSFIGSFLDEQDPEKRVSGTTGVSCWLAMRGVDFIRVHDVAETQEAITMFEACRENRKTNDYSF